MMDRVTAQVNSIIAAEAAALAREALVEAETLAEGIADDFERVVVSPGQMEVLVSTVTPKRSLLETIRRLLSGGSVEEEFTVLCTAPNDNPEKFSQQYSNAVEDDAFWQEIKDEPGMDAAYMSKRPLTVVMPVEEEVTESSGLSTGATIGIAVGAVGAVLLVGIIVVVVIRRKQQSQGTVTKDVELKRAQDSATVSSTVETGEVGLDVAQEGTPPAASSGEEGSALKTEMKTESV